MMKKSLFMLFVLCAILMSTVITFAAGNTSTGPTQPQTSSSTRSQPTASTSSGGSGLGIDIHPIDANQAAQGFVKAGQDFGTVVEGASVPMAVYGIFAALLLIFLGIFNKKFRLMGFGMFAVVILIVVVSGDFMASVHFFYNLGATIRNYWS